jgi:hypothetical protein
MRKLVEYAVYRGEEFIDIGTARELSKRLNVDLEYLYWCACCNRFKKWKRHTKAYEFYKIED